MQKSHKHNPISYTYKWNTIPCWFRRVVDIPSKWNSINQYTFHWPLSEMFANARSPALNSYILYSNYFNVWIANTTYTIYILNLFRKYNIYSMRETPTNDLDGGNARGAQRVVALLQCRFYDTRTLHIWQCANILYTNNTSLLLSCLLLCLSGANKCRKWT